MGEPSDSELLAACREGDESAWNRLVERYASLILSVPSRYGLRRAECDDVFSDVCLALVRTLDSLRDPEALPKWLIRTATRATWDFCRKHRRQPPAPADLPPLTGAAPPDEFAQALEEEQLVRLALAALSERCRKLLSLLYFHRTTLSYDEVARRMGMPRGSLGPTRRRCLDTMRTRLEPALGGKDVSGGA